MKQRPGYTLMEVLVSAAIFATAVLLIFGTYQLTLKLTQEGRELAIASGLAEEMIDAVRSQPFDDIAINATPGAVATAKLSSGFTKTYVSLYQGNDKIKEVRVVVYWDSRPESNAVTLTTLVSQGGIDNEAEGVLEE
jgi:prepilin-type N-terminal cleavage/methylation domain-containing protein